jgi:hypothetical protein
VSKVSQDWISTKSAAKVLKCSRARIYYLIRTGRMDHRHRFTREGKRTEVKLPSQIEKLPWGSLVNGMVSVVECKECEEGRTR